MIHDQEHIQRATSEQGQQQLLGVPESPANVAFHDLAYPVLERERVYGALRMEQDRQQNAGTPDASGDRHGGQGQQGERSTHARSLSRAGLQ